MAAVVVNKKVETGQAKINLLVFYFPVASSNFNYVSYVSVLLIFHLAIDFQVFGPTN